MNPVVLLLPRECAPAPILHERRSGSCVEEKIPIPTAFRPRTVQQVASCYTGRNKLGPHVILVINPYPTAFPYGNGMVLHFYQQQENSTTKTVHKVINKGLKAYV